MSSTSKRIHRVCSRYLSQKKNTQWKYMKSSLVIILYRGRYDIAKTKVKRLLDLEGEPDLPLEKSNTPRVDTKVLYNLRARFEFMSSSPPLVEFFFCCHVALVYRDCMQHIMTTTHTKKERIDHFPVCKKKEKKQNSCYCSLVMVIRERSSSAQSEKYI
jgi:hypothetical protein